MGYDREFVESKASGADQLQYNVERRARKDRTLDFTYRTDEAAKLVEYIEAYVKIDWDNDGIAELRKICCMGSDHEIVNLSLIHI